MFALFVHAVLDLFGHTVNNQHQASSHACTTYVQGYQYNLRALKEIYDKKKQKTMVDKKSYQLRSWFAFV